MRTKHEQKETTMCVKTTANNMTEMRQYKRECKQLVKEGKIRNVKVRKVGSDWLFSWDWC